MLTSAYKQRFYYVGIPAVTLHNSSSELEGLAAVKSIICKAGNELIVCLLLVDDLIDYKKVEIR